MFPSTDDLEREYLSWNDIDNLIDHLLPQFTGDFDGFPMFNSDGSQLVFASNRGNELPRETNLFIADWVE